MHKKKYKAVGQPYLVDIVTLPILFGRFWEQWMQKYIETLSASKQGIILDIGANIGTHTLFMSNYHPVWAFEPQKKTFNILLRNLEMNNIKNVRSFNVGLSNKEKTAQMNPVTFWNVGWNRIGKDGESISLKSLDKIWMENDCPQVSFIKIDVEGHELRVFEGAKKLINSQHPPILLEDHSGEAVEYLKKIGYKIRLIRKLTNDYLAEYS